MKYIPLTNSPYRAIVDDDAFEMVIEHNWALTWHSNGKPRAVSSSIYSEPVLLHQLIVAAPIGFLIDHKNKNVLDNRRENLRIATKSQNAANSSKSLKPMTSKYKGVSWCKQSEKWRAVIQVNSKFIHLGRFDKEITAARRYNNAAKEYFGEFAQLNEFGDPLLGVETKGEKE